MPHTTSTPTPAALTELADQWTVLRERYAFLTEALLRLIRDHSDLASDVIQGAIQNAEDAQYKAAAFNDALHALREQTQRTGTPEDSS